MYHYDRFDQGSPEPLCVYTCVSTCKGRREMELMVPSMHTPLHRNGISLENASKQVTSLMKHHTRFDDVYDRKDLFPCDRMCVVITLVESRWLKQPRNDGSELLSCIFGNSCRRLKFHAQILQIIGQLLLYMK